MFADDGASLSFGTMNLEVCSLHKLEYQEILERVTAAGDVCAAEGQHGTSHEEIEQVSAKLSKMFDSAAHGACWEDLCHQEYNDGSEDFNDYEFMLNEAKSFLAHVANCSSAELEFDTCLIEKTIGLMIDASGARDAEASESNSFHRLRALSSTTSTTEQELEHDGCDKPDMDTAAIDFFVNEAATVCYDKDGIQVDADEINQAVNAFSTILSDNHQCWDAACDDSPYNEDRGGDDPFVGYGEMTDLIDAIMDEALTCPGVEVDPHSCLVTNLLLLLQKRDAPVGADADSSFGSNRRRLIHSSGMCFPPEIDEDSIRGIAGIAQSICNNAGIDVTQNEIDHTVATVMTALSGDCWDKICHRISVESLVFALGKCRVVVVGGWCCCFWRLLLLVDSNIITRIPRIYHGSLTVPELPPFKIQTKSLTAAACLSTRPRA